MTKQEKATIDEVATDLKWVVKTLTSMDEHFKTLNNNVAKNTLNTAVNSTNITGNRRMTSRQWGVMVALICSAVGLRVGGIL